MKKKTTAKVDLNKEIEKLPFCKMVNRRRNFWSTEPTGNYETDCQTGKKYAELALSYMRLVDSRMPGRFFFVWVVLAMTKEKDNGNDGIKVGFLDSMGKAVMALSLSKGSVFVGAIEKAAKKGLHDLGGAGAHRKALLGKESERHHLSG